MSDRREHKERGAILGLNEYVDQCERSGQTPDLLTALVHMWFGSFCADLPDIVDDPSRGPWHRHLAHSKELRVGLQTAYNNARAQGNSLHAACIRGALQHLEDDSKTPAGLPSAGKIIVSRILSWLE